MVLSSIFYVSNHDFPSSEPLRVLVQTHYTPIQDLTDTMSHLEKIFKASFLKGDGVPPTHSPEVAALHASALLSWALLLSIAPPFVTDQYVKRYVQ